MTFDLAGSIEILARTPEVLRTLLSGLPDHWTRRNEGGESWSPFNVVGHLIDGERTDWIPRARIILNREKRAFDPFNRFAHLREAAGRSLEELLDTFAVLREQNVAMLRSWNLDAASLALPGLHPELGPVNLEQLLATWVVHDLGHIAQIVRVMSKQYAQEVGPWQAYLPVLSR